jgi:hypothetical protein
MTTLLPNWTPEKVMALAPDPESAKAAKKLAGPDKWVLLGHDAYTVWGEYKGSGTTPYQVKIDLLRLEKSESTAFHCTCPSRKQPCKHCLGLLFILTDKFDAVAEMSPPAFVQEWLDKEAQRVRKQEDKKKRTDKKAPNPANREKTLAERRQKMAAGIEELDLWLHNLIRHGLADPQIKQYSFWDTKAARMVDAQAPGLAQWLRNLAGFPATGDGWIERLLGELGRLHLLIEGYKRFDELPLPIQADLRVVLGWWQKRDELSGQEPSVRDEWLVLGRYETQEEERLRSQRIWLRGTATQQEALILEFTYGDAPFDTLLTPGLLVDADMVFFPSNFPLRAFLQHTYGPIRKGSVMAGKPLLNNIAAYSHALAYNPWLLQFPFLLDAVFPTRLSGKWIVRDAEGLYIPVANRFQHKWSLLALSGGHPITLAGEWDGSEFLPTGVLVEGRFVDFNQVDKL